MVYAPSDLILNRYADILVKFALNGGKGIKKGDVVFIQVPESAKPMLYALRRSVLTAGGNPIVQYIPEGDSRHFYNREFFELASDAQIGFFADKLLKGRAEQIDHLISILAESNKYELKGIDSKKIMIAQRAGLPYKKWLEEKENAGKFTWTLALYGTPAMAQDVGLSEKEYWKQITDACFLQEKNPVAKWRKVFGEIGKFQKKLNSLAIEKLHIVSKNTDLWVGVGRNRRWLGGSGRNIPSFELFISPDCRMTQGHITFTQPLYRYGNRISGIRLEFKDGKVVKATAKENEKLLRDMISVKGANMIGEFSLTDGRHSRITKFMGNTLYDENVGGKEGNTHIAVGSAYKDSFTGNPSKVPKAKWKQMGFNESAVHTDIISTERRTVTAYLANGSTKVIYKNGKFVL